MTVYKSQRQLHNQILVFPTTTSYTVLEQETPMATPAPLSFEPQLAPITFPVIGELKLKEVFRTITIDTDTCIDWLRDNGLLAHGMRCKCGTIMRIGSFAGISEGKGWRCPEKGCKKFASFRVGSFFEGSNLPLTELVEFLYFWAENLQTTSFLKKNLDWSEHTITDWKNFLRDLCVELNLVNPQPIGGPGHVVEIDESKFGHRKYSRGRLLSGQWVFGGIDRDTKEVFMIPVHDRSAATLIPIIVKYVLPGTTILSDEWASYHNIPAATFAHLTVNHSLHFVDPTTGVHTQTIESTWGGAKRFLRNSMTTNPELLETHLSEVCWRKKNGENTFNELIKEIRNQYPVV